MWKSSIMFTAALLVPTMGCDIDVNDPGALPDIEVKNGRAPDIDVRGPDVDVHTEEKKIDVPTDIDVKTEKKTIKVPDVDVTLPQENDK